MKKEKTSKASIFLKGLITENPVLVLVLGTCPALAQTGSFINALGMGVAATVVLISSNTAISALRKIIPDSVRIPSYIVVIAAFVTLVQMVMTAQTRILHDRIPSGKNMLRKIELNIINTDQLLSFLLVFLTNSAFLIILYSQSLASSIVV